MRADNTHHITAAARRRAEQTRQRAVTTLRRMDAAGQRINFDAVSREASVSRSWLYSQPDLRAEISRLRDRQGPHRTSTPSVPDRQRASDASLLRRLNSVTDRVRQLENENRQLRDALARALGQQRTDHVLGTGGHLFSG
jgi:uncharacterized protein DUF6262